MIRELYNDGLRWTVREVNTTHVPGARSDRCLLFESDGIVRRVWDFPDDWDALPNPALWALVERRQSSRSLGPELQIGRGPTRREDVERLGGPTAVTARTRLLLGEVAATRKVDASRTDDYERALARCGAVRADMRAAVRAYAEALRSDGVPPERALVFIKSAMQAAMKSAPTGDAGAEQVLHEGVEWCIAAYYAA